MNSYLDSSLLKPIVTDVTNKCDTFAGWCRQQMCRYPKIPDIDMQRLKGLSF